MKKNLFKCLTLLFAFAFCIVFAVPEKAFAAAGNLSVTHSPNMVYINEGQSVTLSVSASDDDMSTVTYKWYTLEGSSSGNILSTGSNYSLTPSEYCTKVYCDVEDGSEDYQTVAFRVFMRNGLIYSYDDEVWGGLGNDITLSVHTTSNKMYGITYKWWKKNANGDLTAIAGATSRTYKFTLTDAAKGDYVCRITDYYGNTAEADIEAKVCTHQWDNGAVTKKATYDSAGVKTYTCTICRETKTEAIAKKKVKKNITITKGALKYKVTSIGSTRTVRVVGSTSSKSSITSIVIPSSIKIDKKSYRVTAISANAFKNCTNLRKITIKTSVLSSIGSNAIKGIYSKAKIYVPKRNLTAYKKLLSKKTGYLSTMKIKKF